MFVALVRGRIKFDLAELPEKVRLQHQFGDMVDRQVNWRYFTKILNVREEMKYCRETCENNIPKPNKLSGTGRTGRPNLPAGHRQLTRAHLREARAPIPSNPAPNILCIFMTSANSLDIDLYNKC